MAATSVVARGFDRRFARGVNFGGMVWLGLKALADISGGRFGLVRNSPPTLVLTASDRRSLAQPPLPVGVPQAVQSVDAPMSAGGL